MARRPPLLPLLATALAALLALLAFLQYRWLGQVSDGERQRLRATLEARARDFARDFDREVTRAVGSFHVPTSATGTIDAAALAARWDEWRQGAPYPELVRDVYSLELPPGRDPEIRRLDRAGRQFVASDWPAELEAWRGAQAAPRSTPPDGGGARIQALLASIEDTPIVLVTTPRVRVYSRGEGPPPEPVVPPATSFVLVTLDLEQIRARILPQLVGRYFSTEDIFDYRVAVTSRRDPGRLIFSTDPAPANTGRGAAAPDAVVPLFAVRISEFSALFVPHAEQLAGMAAAGPAGDGRNMIWTTPGHPVAGPKTNAGASGPGAGRSGGGTTQNSSDRLAVSVIRLRSPGGAGTVGLDGTPGRWQLRLAHRAGSVDAAVARARNRNLLVSSTVLLLLAASFAVMVVATRRAQRLAAQQVEFVAGVTHELRTPLTVIRSAGENLADGVVESPEEVKQYGALITGEGRKLGAMVERVMEYAGMQGSTAPGPRERVDVGGLVEEALQGTRRLPAARAATVETAVAEGLPPVLGDAPALARAIENLVENALKYGRAEGAEPWVRVSARAEGSGARRRVIIEVSDAGPGVEPSEREAIFEPFVRGRAAVAARVPGTGLGLSLVRRVVEAHGGRVEVRPDTAAGACFVITLPASPDTPD